MKKTTKGRLQETRRKEEMKNEETRKGGNEETKK